MVRLPDKAVQLAPENRAVLDMDIEWSTPNTPYKAILQVVADVLDSSLSGADSFVSIGTTRDKSALTLMVQMGGQRHNLYAPTLRLLDEQAQSLL